MIGDDKVRTLITITKEMKFELEQLAKDDNRSVSNFIVKILRDYINNRKSE